MFNTYKAIFSCMILVIKYSIQRLILAIVLFVIQNFAWSIPWSIGLSAFKFIQFISSWKLYFIYRVCLRKSKGRRCNSKLKTVLFIFRNYLNYSSIPFWVAYLVNVFNWVRLNQINNFYTIIFVSDLGDVQILIAEPLRVRLFLSPFKNIYWPTVPLVTNLYLSLIDVIY